MSNQDDAMLIDPEGIQTTQLEAVVSSRSAARYPSSRGGPAAHIN